MQKAFLKSQNSRQSESVPTKPGQVVLKEAGNNNNNHENNSELRTLPSALRSLTSDL